MTRAPDFRSAVLESAARGGVLARRRVGRATFLSIVLHAAAAAWLFVIGLMDVGPVPPPPLTIRFFAAPPVPPHVVPLREAHMTPPPKPLPAPAIARIPPLENPAPEPARPTPPPIRVDPDPLPIRITDAAPRVEIRDTAPPAPPTPTIAPVGAHTKLQMGSGEEPELALIVPGKDRERGPGGGVAGKDMISTPPPGDPLGSIRRGGAGGGSGGAAALGSEGAFTGAGIASFLGRKYGVTLMDASRLGSRTNEGARYALLVPALSEAYRSVPFHGRRLGPTGDPVESVQVDAQAIAIRYRDGTVHVLVPTSDGLVALYVSATSTGDRSKVREAERALNALQRLAHDGVRG